MKLEHYTIRIDGKRSLVAVVSELTLGRISSDLTEIGAEQFGPSCWVIDDFVTIEAIHAAIGALEDHEVVYHFAHGRERMEIGIFVAQKREIGVVIKPIAP